MAILVRQKILIDGEEFEHGRGVPLNVNVNSTGCLVIAHGDELVLALNNNSWRTVLIKWEEIEKESRE